MKVLRSTLVIGLAAFAAACGDKVNIVQPTSETPVPTINGVTVTPGTATLSIGQTVNFTAAVDASNGAATTVTWGSSDASKVSVDASGKATAVAATPGVAICATSTANTGKVGCASVVVQANVNIPATVSISGITANGVGTTVNPAAVAGTIDIGANIAPGSQTVTKIVAMIGTTRADSQTFSAAQSAALRYAADKAIETQSAFPPVLFSINTAKFNATTGAPTWTNASYAVSVVLYTAAGGSTAASTATYQTPLTFANANTYVLTTSTTGGATATSGAGYSYRSGSISASVLPVVYTGVTMAAGSITFGAAGCDATGPRTLALTAPVAPATAWTATFTNAAGAGAAGNFKSYEFRTAVGACAAVIGTGEGFTVASTDTNGNTLFGGIAAANAAANTYRMDNVAPGAPTLVQNPNGRQNAWINAAVGMTGANTGATSNNWMVNGAADAGVGGYTRLARLGAPGAGGIVDPVEALAASNTPTLPAPSATNLSYCGVFSAKDLLGNESALPAAGTVCTAPVVASNTALAAQHMMFGVDIAAPTIAFSGGMAAGSAGTNGRTGANVGGEFQVAVNDTGTVGNSGMQATTPVIGTVTIRSAAVGLTAAQTCPVGTVSGGVCTASGTGFAAPAFPLVATAAVTAQTIIGYYTYTGTAVDAAGNASASVSRVVAYNPAANVPALTASLYSTPLTGPTATFTATGSSGNTTANAATTFFDLWKVSYNLTYAGGLAGPLLYPSTTLNTFNGTMLNSNVPVTITLNGFVRQMENQTSACNAALTVGGAFKPNQLQENLFDQVNNASGAVNTAIPGASVAAGTSYTGVAATQQTFSFIVGNGVTEQPTAGGCPAAVGANAVKKVSGGGTSADAASITLSADVWGPTATFNPPFARVDFYVLVGANLEQIGSTTTFSTTDDGSAQGRKHSYTFSWTPGSKTPISAANWTAQSSAACAVPAASIYAIGVSASGDGLVTPVNQNVCITTAP